MRTDGTVACVGCGGTVPDVDGPTHAYMLASPGCWELYGRWSAELFSSSRATPVVVAHHVDCYAVQHPGNAAEDRRQRQSVAVHLVSLCLLLERGQPPRASTRSRARTTSTVLPAMGLDDWPLLEPPPRPGATTLGDVAATAADGAELERVVLRWAEDCWQAWSEHHETVRTWADVLARSP